MTHIESNFNEKDIDLSLLQALSCQCLESGDVFIGNVIFDKPHGPGKLLYPHLDAFGRKFYKGEFVDGLCHGHGSMAWQDGTIYQGEWKFGKPDGFGVEHYPSGALYIGQFSNDLRHGLGKYVSNDNAIWSKWKDGHQYGVCIEETADGGVTFLEYDDSGLLKTGQNPLSVHLSNSTIVQHIKANADAVEKFAIQIQGRVIREWTNLQFIDSVIVPTRPSSPECELANTRKSLRPRFPTTAIDSEQENNSRFSAGNGAGLNLERFRILESENLEYGIDDSSSRQEATNNTKLRLAMERMKKSLLCRCLGDSDCTDNSECKIIDPCDRHVLGKEVILSATKQAFVLYEKQNSRFRSLLNQILADLEKIQQNEKDLNPIIRDLISRVNQLARSALNEQNCILMQCRQILDQDPVCHPDQIVYDPSEFDSELDDLNHWLDDLHFLSSRLPGYLLEFSDYFECFVEDVLKDAAETALQLEYEEHKTLGLNTNEETANRSELTFDTRIGLSTSDYKPSTAAFVTNHIAEDTIRNIYDALRDLSIRMRCMLQNLNKSVRVPAESGKISANQMVLPPEISCSNTELETVVSGLEKKLMSLDNRMDSVHEIQIDMQNAQVEMHSQLRNFLSIQLPALLDSQTASIKHQLLLHLDPLESQRSRFSKALSSSDEEAESAEQEKKVETSSHSLETMSFVENVVQQTVEQVAKNIVCILCHHDENQNQNRRAELSELQAVERSYGQENGSFVFGDIVDKDAGVPSSALVAAIPGVHSVATHGGAELHFLSQLNQAENLQGPKTRTLGDSGGFSPGSYSSIGCSEALQNVSFEAGRKDSDSSKGGGLDFLGSELHEMHQELVEDGERFLNLLNESTYSSLLNSGFLCSRGQIAVVLRKYLAVVTPSIFVDGCDQGSRRSNHLEFETSNVQEGILKSESTHGVTHFDRVKRALSAQSRASFENLEHDGDVLLRRLGSEYLQSIVSTLCEWSGKNVLASAFCLEFGHESNCHTAQTKQLETGKKVDDLVQLGYEAHKLISELGLEYVESLSSAFSEGQRKNSAMSVLLSAQVVADCSHDHVVSRKQRMMRCLSAKSIETLQSLISDAKVLLSKIDNDCYDLIGMLKETAHSNLVAASIYHAVSSITESDDIVTQARNLLLRLLEQGEDLNVILQGNNDGDDDVLSLIFNHSGASSPLSAILYGSLCTVSNIGPKDPATFRRMLSAKTKRNLDLLLTEGRLLLSKLGENITDDLMNDIHEKAKASPLSSLLLYELLNNSVDSSTAPNGGMLSRQLSAQCQASILDLLGEGRSLLVNLNNDHAEGILTTIFENSLQCPVARILSCEILSSNHVISVDSSAYKRSCSARSRKYLQELLTEGKNLLCALERQDTSVLLDTICENIHENTISSILYFEIVAHWFRSERGFQDVKRYRRALNHYSQNMLLDLMKECMTLLEQLNSNMSCDLVSTLVESREQSPLSRVILHKVLQGVNPSSYRTDSINNKGQIIIKELLIEGQLLIERIGTSHFDNILPLICSNFKQNPLKAVIFNEILKSFIADNQDKLVAHALCFEHDFKAYLDSKFCARLGEFLIEGQSLFESLGDVYAKSLLNTVVKSAGNNPMAALLYSSNLVTLKDSLQESRSGPIESIKSALSARSLKRYDDMISEGEELLGAIDPVYANYIVESISEKNSVLAFELMNEILQFVPDDASLSSNTMGDESVNVFDASDDCLLARSSSAIEMTDEICVPVLSEALAAEILQRAARMHHSRQIWRMKWKVHSVVVLQCAFRIFQARNVFRFRKKISNFVNYPRKAPVPDTSIKTEMDSEQFCNSYYTPLSLVFPIFKTKSRKSRSRSRYEYKVLWWRQLDRNQNSYFRNQIRWMRKRNQEARRRYIIEELLKAKVESGLPFSNLNLIKCITRLRAKNLSACSGCKILAAGSRSEYQESELSFVSRKFRRSSILIQKAFRTHKARERFAAAFVQRENILVAGLKIFHWITKCSHLRHFRKEMKSRLLCLTQVKSASCIQQMFRVHLARLDYRYLKRFMSISDQQLPNSTLSTTQAATKLQKLWMGHKGRSTVANIVLRMKQQNSHQQEHEAAISIQSAMRIKWARHCFVVANGSFCNTFFSTAAKSIQLNYRSHSARMHVQRLRKSLRVMQIFVTKLSWLKTLADLVRVSVVEWHSVFQGESKSIDTQSTPFSKAQTFAPAAFPTWWLTHFPVSMSSRTDLKADVFHLLEDQIRIDRTNALGGASSFSKTLEMIGLLVNEVTQSHAVALSMSDSYSVVISLMAFCNMHGTRLMSSVDEVSKKAGNDLLAYADRLADGPCFSLPGLPERMEFRRWTQSNICRMNYLRSDFHKTAQFARLLIASDNGVDRSDSLVSIVGHVYLGIAQSKLGKHVTAAATFQKALDILGKWSSDDMQRCWSSFCCTKELERFYVCTSAHIAAVCFHNMAIELVACQQYRESLVSISRAFILAEKDMHREPIFLRRVKHTKIAIHQLCGIYDIFHDEQGIRQETVRSSSLFEKEPIMALSFKRVPARLASSHNLLTTSNAYMCSSNTVENSCLDAPRSDTSKQRFGAWFPPSIAFKHQVSCPKPGFHKYDAPDHGSCKEKSLFVKMTCVPDSNEEIQKSSTRRLSPLISSILPQTDLQKYPIFLAAFPIETKDAFEIVCEESEDMHTAVENDKSRSSNLSNIFVKEFRRLSSSASYKSMQSAITYRKMMDIIALCNRVVLRYIMHRCMQRCASKDQESAVSLKAVEKLLSIALALMSGPLKEDMQVHTADMRALTYHSRSLFLMLKNEHQQALWVLSDTLRENSVNSTCKQKIVFLLNYSSCLSMLSRHKESFDASYQAWTLLQMTQNSDDWFCYSVTHNERELTTHHWNSFAALCKFQLAKESLFLGFEGPCLGFAEESKSFLSKVVCRNGNSDDTLTEVLQALTEEASRRALTLKRTNLNSFSSFSSPFLSLQSPESIKSGKSKSHLRYAWASPAKLSATDTSSFLAVSLKASNQST